MHSAARHEFHGYPLRQRSFAVADATYTLVGPANYESLVDDPRVIRRFERDEFMPYWAEFWPASLVLADLVGAWPRAGDDPPRVLELGCGLGLVSLIAAARGYRVIASDYEDDALAFVEENARRNGVPRPELRFIDWRLRYPELVFDRIVASDVLYETRCLRPVSEFLYEHLAPDSFALVVDSFRAPADGFESIARHCGLSVEITETTRPIDDRDEPLRYRIFTIRRKT